MNERTGQPDVQHLAAFAADPLGGNPAGVVLDATGLDDATMLALAAQLGYSESAFLTPDGSDYRVRYFSPLMEVPFCGHATVAAAVALARRDGAGDVVFHTQAGEVPVHTEITWEGAVVATLTSPPTRSDPAPPEVVEAALSALRWSSDDIESAWPAHVAHAGNDHLVLAASSRQRLTTLDYDVAALRDLMVEQGYTTLQLIFTEDGSTFHARDPFPVGGVYEDPATGSAAAALGAYLNAVLGPQDRTFTVLQGEDMGQPSQLDVRTRADSDRVEVSGAAVPMGA